VRVCELFHLVALGNDLAVGDDLDGALVDLGGDVERLEEGGLGGVKAGGALGDGHRHGGDDARLGGRGLDELADDSVHDVELAVGEDVAHVADHVRQQALPLGVIAVGAHVLDAAADHRVLAEDELGLAAERDADVGDLLGADEVHIDQEGPRVLAQALLEVGEVGDLLAASDHL